MINRKSIFLFFCGVFLLFGLILLAYFILLHFGGEDLENSIDSLWGSFKKILLKNGLFLFLAISILPGFVLPVAPLLTLAGLWAEQHGAWTACFFCVLSKCHGAVLEQEGRGLGTYSEEMPGFWCGGKWAESFVVGDLSWRG